METLLSKRVSILCDLKGISFRRPNLGRGYKFHVIRAKILYFRPIYRVASEGKVKALSIAPNVAKREKKDRAKPTTNSSHSNECRLKQARLAKDIFIELMKPEEEYAEKFESRFKHFRLKRKPKLSTAPHARCLGGQEFQARRATQSVLDC